MASKLEVKGKYLEYLNSEEWKALRDKAYERAGHKCELCRHEAGAVHHIKYPKNLADDDLSNLLVVCTLCHDKLHGKSVDVKREGREVEAVDCNDLALYVKTKKDLQRWWMLAEERALVLDALIGELDDKEDTLGVQGEIRTTKIYLLLEQERKQLASRQRFIESTGVLRGD